MRRSGSGGAVPEARACSSRSQEDGRPDLGAADGRPSSHEAGRRRARGPGCDQPTRVRPAAGGINAASVPAFAQVRPSSLNPRRDRPIPPRVRATRDQHYGRLRLGYSPVAYNDQPYAADRPPCSWNPSPSGLTHINHLGWGPSRICHLPELPQSRIYRRGRAPTPLSSYANLL
jgi:hypothetical protein